MSAASFQPGDVRVRAGRREFTLRLTLGSLAELCDRFETLDLRALARRLRRPAPADTEHLARALLRPAHGGAADALSQVVPREALLPAAAKLFEEAFR